MADGEDFSQLLLVDQFAHKNWKARKGGYETAAKEFKVAQPSDPLVRDFNDGQLWKAAVSDSNVAAQLEALAAYNAFLEASGTEGARRTRAGAVPGLVEKGLMGRPAWKQAAQESLLLLIELDRPEPIIEELMPFLAHKQPKIIAATLSALTDIFHNYGCRVVEPKPVIKVLPKIYGHADKNVRAEGQNLTVELYRWLREAMKPLFWGELKDVQQKDLEKLFEPVKAEPAPKQERLLLSQQAAKEVAESAGDGVVDGDDAGDDDAAIDLEPEFEAVDVFAKIPKDFSDRLAGTKWSDRKTVLEELLAAVNVPAIQEGPFDDIIRGLAKSMKDTNISVVIVAANCVECLAKGLRQSFSRYRSTILEPMMERFKEKKQTVTDALAAACDAVSAATSLADIETNVLEALKNKNPSVREQSAKFLCRSLKMTPIAPTIEQTKEFAEAAKKLLTESVAPLRDAGAEILGVLWKIMGDRNTLAHLEGLDDIRKNKIKEFSDAAEVRSKWKPKTAAAPAPTARATPAGKKPAAGSRKPAAVAAKKPAPFRAASPLLAEDAPLQPGPTSRPVAKTGAGIRPLGGALKAPGSGLAKPGTSLKGPSGLASPKRQGMLIEDPPQLAAPKFGLAAPGRGLAGRPLGKPSAAPSSPAPAPREDAASSAMSAIERQELAELRLSVESLQQQNSDLRNDKMRLTSQITELQNQNAQLIEDHTRDVLQIKAKETQLVRARSDAETADDRANSLAKEMDRMKREMSRLGRDRAGSDAPSEYAAANGDHYSRAPSATSTPQAPGIRPAYGSSRSTHQAPSARTYGVDHYGEGKENFLAGGHGDERSKLSGAAHVSAVAPGAHQHSVSSVSRGMSSGSSGRATPASGGLGEVESYHTTTLPYRQSSQDGVESWKRAAEVTQNLKARIEMMKARQNIGRGQ